MLCTTCPACAALLRERLDSQGIGWLEQPVERGKVNLYFGHEACLRVVATFAGKPLHRLTAQEDFILGAMLGYDVRQQCERYCRRARPSAAGPSA